VLELADQVRTTAAPPESLTRFNDVLDASLREQIAVWRAANGVPDDDRTLLGPRPTAWSADRYARHLQRRINDAYPPAVRAWQERINAHLGHAGENTLELARRLDRAQKSGLNAELILRRALAKPLPDDKASEALTYRVQRLITQWQGYDAPEARRVPTRPAAGLEL
jgi:hypothetical protein